MTKLLHAVESALTAVVRWVIDHVPLPAKLHDALRVKRDVLDELVKFSLAGVAATVVFLIVFEPVIIIWPDLPKWQASVIANIPAIAVSYIVSAEFVFKRHAGASRRREVTMFFVFAGLALVIQLSALGIIESVLGHELSPLAATLVVFAATIVSWTMRFITARFLIFKSHLERGPIDTATELAHLVEELDEESQVSGSQHIRVEDEREVKTYSATFRVERNASKRAAEGSTGAARPTDRSA